MPTKEDTTMRSDTALTKITRRSVTFGGSPDVIKITIGRGIWKNLGEPRVLGWTFEGEPEWAVNGNYPVPSK